MLRSAVPVLKEIFKRHPNGGADLENISRIVIGVTRIDRVHYTRYDVPRTNPIWGSFRRFEQHDAAYAGVITGVEVRYAEHLNESERLFVVSKELCHSLEAADGAHSVSDAAMDDLVAAFALYSADQPTDADQPTLDFSIFDVEMLATASAVEMICPLPHRRKKIEACGENPDWAALSVELNVPEPYLKPTSRPSYMNTIESILKHFGLL